MTMRTHTQWERRTRLLAVTVDEVEQALLKRLEALPAARAELLHVLRRPGLRPGGRRHAPWPPGAREFVELLIDLEVDTAASR